MQQAKKIVKEQTSYARQLFTDRAGKILSGDARLFETPPSESEIRKGLEPASTSSQQLTAMKSVLVEMCKGEDMNHLFPQVVQLVHTSSPELRRLVYFYVVHYAAACPNETLLAISAFQRDLQDERPQIRAMALRMISSIPIPSLRSVVLLALKSSTNDKSPIVRRAAGIGVYQVLRGILDELDGEEEEEEDEEEGKMTVATRVERLNSGVLSALKETLMKLMQDEQPNVVGAACMSFNRCGNLLEQYSRGLKEEVRSSPPEGEEREEGEDDDPMARMLHPVFHHWCDLLPMCEPIDQVELLTALTQYARTQFHDPQTSRNSSGSSSTSALSSRQKAFASYSTSSSSASTSSSGSTEDSLELPLYRSSQGGAKKKQRQSKYSMKVPLRELAYQNHARRNTYDRRFGFTADLKTKALDPDHAELLRAVHPLLRQTDPSAVLAAVALFYHAAPVAYCLKHCIHPLIRVLRFYPDRKLVVLMMLNKLAALPTSHSSHRARYTALKSLSPHYPLFFLLPEGEESPEVEMLKLHLLTRVLNQSNATAILLECRSYLRNTRTPSSTVRVIRELANVALQAPSLWSEDGSTSPKGSADRDDTRKSKLSPHATTVFRLLLRRIEDTPASPSGELIIYEAMRVVSLIVQVQKAQEDDADEQREGEEPSLETKEAESLRRMVKRAVWRWMKIDIQQSLKRAHIKKEGGDAGQPANPTSISWGAARAMLLWLVGEMILYDDRIAIAAPDWFRLHLVAFPSFSSEVKREVLALGAKLLLRMEAFSVRTHAEENENENPKSNENEGEKKEEREEVAAAAAAAAAPCLSASHLAEKFHVLFQYALTLGSCDANISLRDYTRLLTKIVGEAAPSLAHASDSSPPEGAIAPFERLSETFLASSKSAPALPEYFAPSPHARTPSLVETGVLSRAKVEEEMQMGSGVQLTQCLRFNEPNVFHRGAATVLSSAIVLPPWRSPDRPLMKAALRSRFARPELFSHPGELFGSSSSSSSESASKSSASYSSFSSQDEQTSGLESFTKGDHPTHSKKKHDFYSDDEDSSSSSDYSSSSGSSGASSEEDED